MSRSPLPLIGITADSFDAAPASLRDALVLPARYLRAVEHAGGVPVMLASQPREAIRRLLEILQGLVLSGGDFDIHPRHYGTKPSRHIGTIKERRTDFELAIASAAMDRDLPVLGVCGGAQAINVALGGSLHQDIAAEFGSSAIEHTSQNPKGRHAVQIQPGSQLFRIFRRGRVQVNTSHHQCVKDLGRGLIVNARADDGVIEGIESTRHTFVLGVQWHPEALAPRHEAQRRLFSSFIACCAGRVRLS
jgi:putative glutamine amidotransferase